MNRDRIEGQLKQLTGRAVEQWGHLTGDDRQVAEGRRSQLKGKLRQRLGEAKDVANRQLDQWKDQVDSVWKKS